MGIHLRYYQKEALSALYKYFQTKQGNPILALPTGTGKSIIIAEWVRFAVQTFPGTRVMMLTHVKELIEQNFEKLLTLWPTAPAGIYSAGVGRKDTAYPVIFAGIQSVCAKPELFGRIDMVLVDECHLVGTAESTRYQAFIDGLRVVNPAVKVIGLSATPYRQGLGLLTESNLFTDIAYDCTERERFVQLIEEGFLAPLVPKQTSYTMDVADVKVQAGEYVLSELQEMFSGSDTNVLALREAIQLAGDRKHWLIFTTGIAHAETVADILNMSGVEAATVHSKMSKGDRTKSIADFKAGNIRALVNSNVLTTGFDFPALDCEIILRPTRSAGLWVQMLGRGTRPHPDKENCLVLDFAGNTARLGPINDPVIPRKRGSRGGGSAPIKVCPICFTLIHTSVRACDQCGYEFPFNERTVETEASTLSLIYTPEKKVEEACITHTFDVDKITYKRHCKQGKPDSIKVIYHCGLQRFSTYLCFEHGGYPTSKAREWWRKMQGSEPVPLTTDEAFERIGDVERAASILVWMKKGYDEILNYTLHAE